MNDLIEPSVARMSFGLPEVSAWAKFSNDFNPIHFDPHYARSAGLGGLVVHGMLALLPVKAALVNAAHDSGAPRSRWMKFRALFRSPVLHESSSELTYRDAKGQGLDFRVHAADTGQERFRGSWGPAADQGAWLDSHPLDRQTFSVLQAAEAERFRSTYPHVRPGWIALDAIVFSDFIRTKLKTLSRAAQRERAGTATPEGKDVLMQASQTVLVDTQELGGPGPLPFDCGELSYAMAAPEMVTSQGGIAGSVSLAVTRREKLVMLVEIGLLARTATD
jgi:hypothetical protein